MEVPTLIVKAHGLSLLDHLVIPANTNVITFSRIDVNLMDQNAFFADLADRFKSNPPELFKFENTGRTITASGKSLEQLITKNNHGKECVIRNHLEGDTMNNLLLSFDPEKNISTHFGIYNTKTKKMDTTVRDEKVQMTLRDLIQKYPDGGVFILLACRQRIKSLGDRLRENYSVPALKLLPIPKDISATARDELMAKRKRQQLQYDRDKAAKKVQEDKFMQTLENVYVDPINQLEKKKVRQYILALRKGPELTFASLKARLSYDGTKQSAANYLNRLIDLNMQDAKKTLESARNDTEKADAMDAMEQLKAHFVRLVRPFPKHPQLYVDSLATRTYNEILGQAVHAGVKTFDELLHFVEERDKTFHATAQANSDNTDLRRDLEASDENDYERHLRDQTRVQQERRKLGQPTQPVTRRRESIPFRAHSDSRHGRGGTRKRTTLTRRNRARRRSLKWQSRSR
jgi:hypothetical protein